MMAVLAIFVFGTAQAQNTTSLKAEKAGVEASKRAKSPEEKAKMKTKRMTEELGLTDEQQQAVYAIALEQATEAERERMRREEARKRAMASMKRSDQRIVEILNEEQRVKWEAMKEEHREKRQERMEHRRERRGEMKK